MKQKFLITIFYAVLILNMVDFFHLSNHVFGRSYVGADIFAYVEHANHIETVLEVADNCHVVQSDNCNICSNFQIFYGVLLCSALAIFIFGIINNIFCLFTKLIFQKFDIFSPRGPPLF